MCKESDPCYGCERRCVKSGYNCHSDCPDYKDYKQEAEKRAELIRKKKAEESLFIDTRLKAIRKTQKKNKWLVGKDEL